MCANIAKPLNLRLMTHGGYINEYFYYAYNMRILQQHFDLYTNLYFKNSLRVLNSPTVILQFFFIELDIAWSTQAKEHVYGVCSTLSHWSDTLLLY